MIGAVYMSSIGKVRRAKGMTQKELAGLLDVDTVTVSRYENDDGKLNLPLLRRIAEHLGVRVADLLDEEDAGNAVGHTALPEYDIRAAAGGGALNDGEEVVDTWLFSPAQMLSMGLNSTSAGMIRIVGDSMEPTLRSGSRVIIDRTDQDISTPGIFVVWDGAGLVIKRLERVFGSEPRKVKVKSDNPLHDEYLVHEEDLRVIGRACVEIKRI